MITAKFPRRTYEVVFYKNILRQWRWRIKASNGKIIASSSEGFWNKKDCIHNAKLTAESLADHFTKNPND